MINQPRLSVALLALAALAYPIGTVCDAASKVAPQVMEQEVSQREACTPMPVTNPWCAMQSGMKNAVVQIFSQAAAFDWLQPYKSPEVGGGSGSGFFINEEGDIITNAHVVDQTKALSIQIQELGKERLDVTVVGFCPDRDLALLRPTPKSLKKIKEQLGSLSILSFGDSDTVRRADEIMSLGYPLGQESLKSTRGVVSGREHVVGRQMIQVDVPINPGNSGGPAIDINGKVIGINTASMVGMGISNVHYIIPINELKLVLKELSNTPGKLLRKPYLGVYYHASNNTLTEFLGNPVPGGPYVSDVFKGSVLDEAGLKSGDMIYSFNGHRVDMYGDISVPWSEDKITMIDYSAHIPLNSQVTMSIYRAGKPKELKFNLKLGKVPDIRQKYPDYEHIDYEVMGGMVVMELARNHIPLLLNHSPELIQFEEPKNQLKSTLVITHVIPDSVAQRSRVIMVGNRIDQVNGVTVRTIDELRKAFEKSITDDVLRVKLSNGVVTAFPLQQIIADEPRLSAIYRYPVSKVVQEMYAMKQYNEQQKALGSQTTRAVSA